MRLFSSRHCPLIPPDTTLIRLHRHFELHPKCPPNLRAVRSASPHALCLHHLPNLRIQSQGKVLAVFFRARHLLFSCYLVHNSTTKIPEFPHHTPNHQRPEGHAPQSVSNQVKIHIAPRYLNVMQSVFCLILLCNCLFDILILSQYLRDFLAFSSGLASTMRWY